MKYLIFLIPFSVSALLLMLLWSGWETVYPRWGRVLLSMAIFILIVLVVWFRKESRKLVVEANILAGTVLISIAYFLVPFDGVSVTDQYIKSCRHLADPTLPIGEVGNFSNWLAEGEIIHKRCPWSQSQFRDSANKRLVETLSLIQIRLKDSSEELRLYEQWNHLIPDLPSRLPADNPYVKRMNKLLSESALFQEIYGKFRSSILREDRKATAECLERLRQEFSATHSNPHLRLLMRRMIAMAEFLGIPSDSSSVTSTNSFHPDTTAIH